MPTWSEILRECQTQGEQGLQIDYGKVESKRIQYLSEISNYTQRNTIAYYSGWMYRNAEDASINDKDINAFMETVAGLDNSKGLDLILHTPGGEIAATEHIINYLQSIFGTDIRAIVPQMAMSAGTMISVSCKEIIMGKQSSLGPFDPQLGGVACQSVISEFERAKEDVRKAPHSLGLWQTIIGKYNPTFILSCEQAIELTNELADKVLLRSIACHDTRNAIKRVFNDNTTSKIHSRHFSKEKAKAAGLNIKDLEDDQQFQDLILSYHHSCIITLETTSIVKMLENQDAKRYLRTI